MTSERKQLLLAVILIVAATAVAYAPAVDNGFTNWDDNSLVTDNGMIRSLSIANVSHIFSSMHYAHYHPLVILSFAVEYHFFRLDPWIYHATNVILHILNTLLVFYFLRILRGGLALPLAVALLFGVHPLHAESVAWVTERKDVLYSFFYLLALIAYVLYVRKNRKKYFLLTAIAFLCSLFSKAMAVTLPVVLLLIDYLEGRNFDRSVLIEKVPFLALSFLFGIIAVLATYPATNMAATASIGFDNILIAFHGLVFYAWKFVYPWGLSSVYPYPGGTLPIQFTLAPFIVIGALVLAALTRKKTRVAIFCLAFYFVTLSPVLQLAKVGGVIAADRFVYIPILGLILAAAEGIRWLVLIRFGGSLLLRRTTIAAFALALFALGFASRERTTIWKDSISLWDDVLRQHPELPIAQNNRGVAHADRRDFRKAIDDYDAGLALDRQDWKLWFNRGNALRELGAFSEAVSDYDTSLSRFPANADAYYYRGLVFHSLGRFKEAIDDYSQAIKLNPERIEAFVNRGAIFAGAKDFAKSLADFNAGLALDPDDPDGYFNRGAVYRSMGKLDAALVDFNTSLVLQPRNAKTLNFRGMTYFQIGEFDKAIVDYDRAIDNEPSNGNLYNNRGAALYQKREFDKAVADYTVALSFSPNNYEALTNRAFAYCASQKFGAARQDLAALRKLRAWIDPRLIELTGQ